MALSKINPSNLIYLGICIIGIVAFMLVGIFPNLQAMSQIDDDIAQLSQQVQYQELLYPVFRQLVKEVQQPVPTQLVLPATVALSQKDLNQINDLFRQTARQSDVDFVSAIPDASSYLEDAGRLILHVTFKGDFFSFRKLLFNLCALPYLESIDQMRIDSEAAEKTIQLKLRLMQG
jgi:hypothetical protein